MYRFYFVVLLVFESLCIHAQQFSQVCLAGGSDFKYYGFSAASNLLIRISDDGTIIDFGSEISSIRNNEYYSPQLQPYPGRVDYYPQGFDSAVAGKIRNIGFVSITWYPASESRYRRGKLKSIGSMFFDYFDEFSINEPVGKIKRIGSTVISYYSKFEDEAVRGKIRSIGNTEITYYSFFEDRQVKGKVKSIGSYYYAWYSSFDLNRYGLKAGSYRRNISGITYIVL